MSDGSIVLIDNKDMYISDNFPSMMSLSDCGIDILSILKNKFKNKKDLTEKIMNYIEEDGFLRIVNKNGVLNFNKVNNVRYDMEKNTINFRYNYFGGNIDDTFGWNSEKIYIKNTSNKNFLLNLRDNEEDPELKDFFLKDYILKPNETIVLSYGGIGLEELLYNKFVNEKTEEEIKGMIKSKYYKNNEKNIIKAIKENIFNVEEILVKAFCFKQNMKLRTDFGLSL